MEAGALIAVISFSVMALIAVLVAVIAAIASVVGHMKPEDNDE